MLPPVRIFLRVIAQSLQMHVGRVVAMFERVAGSNPVAMTASDSLCKRPEIYAKLTSRLHLISVTCHKNDSDLRSNPGLTPMAFYFLYLARRFGSGIDAGSVEVGHYRSMPR